MSSNLFLTPEDARKLIHNALLGAGTSSENAEYFTEAILDTELSGLEGHGLLAPVLLCPPAEWKSGWESHSED